MRRYLPSLLLVAWACSPAPSESPAAQAAATTTGGTLASDRPFDSGAAAGGGSAAGAPTASAPKSDAQGGAGATAEQRLKTAHDFFERGPGAVRNPAGDPDGFVSNATQIGGGFSSARIIVRGDPVPGYPGLYNVTLSNTGSGYQEMFLLQVPDSKPVVPVPLLVVFHRYGVSHADALFNTNFIAEARTRGWYMLAPLSASQQNFACLEGQINTEAALHYVTSVCTVDTSRIYGVGFSMGGGVVTSYAARHLDPAAPMFAAIVNHTGDVSLGHTFANESAQVQGVLEGWYGGPPSSAAFNYQRCSVIDLDPITETVRVGTDMSRTPAALPVMDWMASADPVTYLLDQTMAFDQHNHAQNAGNAFTTVSASVHSWSTLDDTQVCDYLAQFTLHEPALSSTLADRDGVYYRFQVAQDAAGAFTPFSWHADAAQNRLSLWATGNLKRLTVDALGLGLAYLGQLHLNMASADGTGDDVLFVGVPYAPLSVTRDGVADSSGTYDAQMHTFLVHETSGSGHLWVLTF
jgi:dienelactone hydrolase